MGRRDYIVEQAGDQSERHGGIQGKEMVGCLDQGTGGNEKKSD